MADHKKKTADVTVQPPQRAIVGVNEKAAKKVEKMLQSGRRYFGSSGAHLTHELTNPEYKDREIDREAGKETLLKVRKTTEILQEWVKDKPNVVLIDSVRTHNWGEESTDEETGLASGGYVDHVLLMGDEVVIIDVKNWGKKKNFTVGDEGEVLRSNKQFHGSDTKMERTIRMWLSYLESDAAITGIICIQGEENSVFRNRNWFTQLFRIVEMDRFEDLLNEKWRSIEAEDQKNINTTLVSQVLVKCIKPFDERSRVLTAKAVSEFRR